MASESERWENYEEVAAFLLGKIRAELQLSSVEGKQKLAGESGATWEVDAKGVRRDDGGVVLIECKRHKRRVDQDTVATLAFRIRDLGASGGILVSPMGLQTGARMVAEATQIVEVRLDPESTNTEYMISFLNRMFVGVADFATFTDHATVIVVTDADSPEKE